MTKKRGRRKGFRQPRKVKLKIARSMRGNKNARGRRRRKR